ncbi:MAG: hypothetical protein AAF517_24950, partial [Planctomycetota bacterium]
MNEDSARPHKRRLLARLIGLTAAILIVCLGYPIAIDQYHIHRLKDEAHWRASADALIERRSTRGLADVVRTVMERDLEKLRDWQERIYLQFDRDERYALPAYSEALLDENKAKQQAVREAIRHYGRRLPGLASILGEALERGDAEARWQHAWLLSSLGPLSKPATPQLIAALASGDEHVRFGAMRALSLQKDPTPEVIDAIVRASRDKSLLVSCFAVDSLAGIRHPTAEARIQELLATKDTRLAHVIRTQAERHEMPQELRKLLRTVILKDENLASPYFEYYETEGALADGFPLKFVSLANDLGFGSAPPRYDDAPSTAFSALWPQTELSAPDWEVFLAALASTNPQRRAAALGLSLLIEAPRDEALRKRLAETLMARLGDRGIGYIGDILPCSADALIAVLHHIDLLLPHLRDELDQPTPRRRVGAILALGCVRDAESLPKLRTILETPPKPKPTGALARFIGDFAKVNRARRIEARLAAAFAVARLDSERDVVPEILESIRDPEANLESPDFYISIPHGLPPFIYFVTEAVGKAAAASNTALTETLSDGESDVVHRALAARLLVQAGQLDPVRLAMKQGEPMNEIYSYLLTHSPGRRSQDINSLVERCLAAESVFAAADSESNFSSAFSSAVQTLGQLGPVASAALEPLLAALDRIDLDTCTQPDDLMTFDGRREEVN